LADSTYVQQDTYQYPRSLQSDFFDNEGRVVAGIDYDVKVMEPVVYRPITAREVLMGSEMRQHAWIGRAGSEAATHLHARREASSSTAVPGPEVDLGNGSARFDAPPTMPCPSEPLELKSEAPEEELDSSSFRSEQESTASSVEEAEGSVAKSFPSTPSDESIVPPSIYSETTADDFGMEECDLQALMGGGDDFHSSEDYELMQLGEAGDDQGLHPWGWLQPDLSIQA